MSVKVEKDEMVMEPKVEDDIEVIVVMEPKVENDDEVIVEPKVEVDDEVIVEPKVEEDDEVVMDPEVEDDDEVVEVMEPKVEDDDEVTVVMEPAKALVKTVAVFLFDVGGMEDVAFSSVDKDLLTLCSCENPETVRTSKCETWFAARARKLHKSDKMFGGCKEKTAVTWAEFMTEITGTCMLCFIESYKDPDFDYYFVFSGGYTVTGGELVFDFAKRFLRQNKELKLNQVTLERVFTLKKLDGPGPKLY